MNETAWWYLARSSGIVALVLMVLSLIWGVALATRVMPTRSGPRWLLELHRWFGSLAVTMTALHLLGLVLDGYIDFGWADILVPGASSYRPVGVAFGVLGLYGLVAVQVSSLMRRHLTRTVWHRIHLISYGVLWASAVHAGLAGSDVASLAYQALAMLLTMAAVAAVLVRLLVPRDDRTPRRRGAERGKGAERGSGSPRHPTEPDAAGSVGAAQ